MARRQECLLPLTLGRRNTYRECPSLALFISQSVFPLMFTSNDDPLVVYSIQQSTQRALYRTGRLKLNETFEPWSDYLQKAMQTAALYGLAINEAEAEAAIECLFEINPQSCWQLLCSDFATADHWGMATIRVKMSHLP